MRYRVLCDENVEPATVGELESRGFTATHVNNEPGKGSDDPELAAYAREHDYVILTNDTDFLDESKYPDVTVLFYANNRLSGHELARRVEELASLVPEQDDLPRETYLND